MKSKKTMSSNHHRSSWLKQSNKSHKGGKHRSAREVDRTRRGKIQGRTSVADGGRARLSGDVRKTREERARNANMERRQKRRNLVAKRRGEGLEVVGMKGVVHKGAPKCIVVVPLCESAVEAAREVALRMLSNKSGGNDASTVCSLASAASFPKHKLRVSVLLRERSSGMFGLLDAVKVADVIVFCTAVAQGGGSTKGSLGNILEHAIDAQGAKDIAAIKSQGAPSVVSIVCGTGEVKQKHRGQVKKQFDHFFAEEFGASAKVVTFEKHGAEREIDALRRALSQIKTKQVTWRSERAYMTAHDAKLGKTPSGVQAVALSGYVRGKALNVHQLVHLPGQGTFQISHIDVHENDPFPLRPSHRAKTGGMDIDAGDAAGSVRTIVARSEHMVSTEEEAEPDVMGGEQTWPTMEEMGIENPEEEVKPPKKLVPKGTSAYQAAWLVGDETYEDETELVEVGAEEDEDRGNLEEDIAAAKALWKTRREEMADDELVFPDEVETPHDVPARLRFAKYRGLKSFRASPWDPKESLPREYSRIVQPENYDALNRSILARAQEEEKSWLQSGTSSMDAVHPGAFVTLYVIGVPEDILERLVARRMPIVIGALLSHEQKITVLHANLQRSMSCDATVRSRDALIMQCGFWRRTVRPVFSENSLNCDKHKFDRFLQPSRWTVATAYAPLTFGTNVPVSLFREGGDSEDVELVASGSLMGADPDRIVLKKIVLSGYPFRVKKRWAVVRFMFFSPDDIKWFKPVEIYTKMGSSGRILDSIGTHGRMKCLFDIPIQQNDTVCMSLYKRIYPKPVAEFASLRQEDAATSSANVKMQN